MKDNVINFYVTPIATFLEVFNCLSHDLSFHILQICGC